MARANGPNQLVAFDDLLVCRHRTCTRCGRGATFEHIWICEATATTRPMALAYLTCERCQALGASAITAHLQGRYSAVLSR